MFFYISQLFSFLVMPIYHFALFLIGCRDIWHQPLLGEEAGADGFSANRIFLQQLSSNWLMYDWEPPPKDFHSLPDYEVGIILTGVTNIDKTPKDRTYFNKGADRVTHAVQLYKMGKIKKNPHHGRFGF